MKTFLNPKAGLWDDICTRPAIDTSTLNATVNGILSAVKTNGDVALKKYNTQFHVLASDFNFSLTQSEINGVDDLLSPELKAAIDVAYNNIYKFHLSQKEETEIIETQSGVQCWREQKGIDKVGLYIPGGTAPLFSTVLMLGIPAQIAGCKVVQMCTPPQADGNIHPAMLYAAKKCGIKNIFKVGGAQAIAALAYGTQSIEKVYKIFGPGNQYVTKAKELVSLQNCAIDMPAGPSELLVFADDTAVPEFVAADLLSQAEHGADSQVLLVSTSANVAEKCISALKNQLPILPRKAMAEKAINNSRSVVFDDVNLAWDFINHYAPEHLIIASEKAEEYAAFVDNAGSVFMGNYTPESAGDYASGTNHTLPTSGFARMYSGVNLASFCTSITFQKISKNGIKSLGKHIEIMAENEELFAHKNAVSLRLKSLEK